MDDKTKGLIATLATTVLCGLPGLLMLCMGGIFAVAGMIPGAEINVFGSSDPGSAIAMGLGMLCVSVIFIAIPVVVGLKTLRRKEEI